MAVVAVVALLLTSPSAQGAGVPACSGGTWSAVKTITKSIATGGSATFTGTVWYKIYTCGGAKTLSRVNQWKAVEKVTATVYQGIQHRMSSAQMNDDDYGTPNWHDETLYTCNDVCTISHLYDVYTSVPYGSKNQMSEYCEACNAGGIGGESSILYYITGIIHCEGVAGSC